MGRIILTNMGRRRRQRHRAPVEGEQVELHGTISQKIWGCQARVRAGFVRRRHQDSGYASRRFPAQSSRPRPHQVRGCGRRPENAWRGGRPDRRRYIRYRSRPADQVN